MTNRPRRRTREPTRIQAISKDVLNVNAGSLYPALYRLEAQGWIRAEWASTESGRKAKVYSVTAAGRKHLADDARPGNDSPAR